MTPTLDIALVEDPDGAVVAHAARCPDVRRRAELGEPVATMLGCRWPQAWPADVRLAPCLARHLALRSRA